MASPLPLQSHHNCLETPKRHKRSDERPCADSENPLNDYEVLLDSGNMASERWPGEDACDQEGDACEHEEDACDAEKEDACEQEEDVQMAEWHMPPAMGAHRQMAQADAGELAEVQVADADVQTTVCQQADAAAQADAGEQEEVQVAGADVQTTVCQQADAAAQADACEQAEVQVADDVQTTVCQQADAAALASAPADSMVAMAELHESLLLSMRSQVLSFLQSKIATSADGEFHPSLLDLWERSCVQRGTLVLPFDAANGIAELHPSGYHHGVWHLAVSYERLVAMALLTNSNPKARGWGQPKSFSAWPRMHTGWFYHQASRFRGSLQDNVCEISPSDRENYVRLISEWHHSVMYISKIDGETRLSAEQLSELCAAIALTNSQQDV